MSYISALGDKFTSGNLALYSRKALRVFVGVSLLAVATFAVLGLVHMHGVDLKAQWLSTALDKIGHKAAFGTVLGVSGVAILVLGILKIRYERRAAAFLKEYVEHQRPQLRVEIEFGDSDFEDDDAPSVVPKDQSLLDGHF